MSALAQYAAKTGYEVAGSDRLGESISTQEIKNTLLNAGCRFFPQDGSGITVKTNAVIISTAIEHSNPDLLKAKELGIPILHRSDLLSDFINSKKSIVVAGTSGKSTVTAMIFELLTACGKSPSLISGAALRSIGSNMFIGQSDLLIVEGDESDGTLIKYTPSRCVILNLSKDHKPEEDVLAMFKALASHSQWSLKNADDPKLASLKTTEDFGFKTGARLIKSDIYQSTVKVKDTLISIPVPGEHNASNLLAALSVCLEEGCSLTELQKAAAGFLGVDRRFVIRKTKKDITVIDDFAHNPEKIKAAARSAHKFSNRVILVFQPHGFGPTRFLKEEYLKLFPSILRQEDQLLLLPIYYAGGTAVKDISSADLAAGTHAFLPDNRDEALEYLKAHAKPGNVILVMGARDPSLPGFVETIVRHFDE